jgi:sugar phosphate isomerase/epimerase
MNESMRRFFKPGLISFMAYPETMRGEGPVLESIRKVLVDDYFDAIEITHIADPDVRAKAKALLEQSHITVCYGAQPRFLSSGKNVNDLDEEKRKEAEALLLDSIDEAEYLGAKGVAFLAGKYDPEKKDEAFAQLLKTTKAACDYAKTKGMMIELEVFDFDLDKKSLIGPAPYAAAFAAEMRNHTNNFGLMVDLSHIPQTYESSKFAIRTMRPYITHLHIGSAVMTPGAEAFGDTHPRFGFPGGVNDVPEVADFLRICLEEGIFDEEDPIVMSFEVKPWGDEDADVVVANAKRVLNRAWAIL